MARNLNSVSRVRENVETLYVWWMLIPLFLESSWHVHHAVMLLMDFIRGAGFQPGSVQCAGRYNATVFFKLFQGSGVFFRKPREIGKSSISRVFRWTCGANIRFFKRHVVLPPHCWHQLFSPENNGETRPWSFLNLHQHPGVFWQHIGEWHRFQKIVFLMSFGKKSYLIVFNVRLTNAS